MTDTTPTCPNCGNSLPEGTDPASCPKCLINNAAWSQTQAGADTSSIAPTIADNSTPRLPPELPDLQDLPDLGGDFGGYKINHLLGRGGMGAVYEAEQIETGRRVALKVLSHKLDSEDARKRFIREGRLAASINHPNSVYVFGTEEIEGTPTISMEIVPGGTLQEKVAADGPMDVPAAVDAILQIIEGLDAAQSIGILHRDVKPSNCFVDDHGTAKIGDFGLSISTEAHGNSHLTVDGALLGTPAFSSPEQLRGDELNARSDMYSVGATLYFLLTGHAPFEEGNMVKLLSRVLEENAPNPRTLRPEIPKALAAVIHRCLAKTPADRFKSYADLTKALQPYSSESPTPGTVALRFGAYMIDSLILGVFGFFFQWAAWGNLGDIINQENIATQKWFSIILALNAVMIVYFGLSDGLRGTTIGKKLLRLHVVGPGGQLPGVPRAILRILVVYIITSIPFLIITLTRPGIMQGQDGWIGSTLLGLTNILSLGIIFCTARRRNGYAGLHDRISNTKIVRTPKTEKRPRLVLGDSTSPSRPLEGSERVGPYHIIEPLGPSPTGRWFLAYDTKLLRQIWVHDVAVDTPQVSRIQRNLNRRGRLRWITGRRSADENWDAYEAPAGKALTELISTPQAWATVRFWLLDLAEELEISAQDGTAPSRLQLNQVWVTADGRAKLLDFPTPGSAPDHQSASYSAAPEFIAAVARASVQISSPPPPLHARTFLIAETPAPLGDFLESLRASIRRPAGVSRLRRIGITTAVSAFPMTGIAFGSMFLAITHDVRKSNPDLLALSTITSITRFADDNSEQRENLRRYIAHRFPDLVNDTEVWKGWDANLIVDPSLRALAAKAIEDYPTLTPDEIAAAEKTASEFLNGKNQPGGIPQMPPESLPIFAVAAWIGYSAVPAIFMALVLRRGLILMMFGTVVATRTGERASRLRCLWRSLITWSPFLVVTLATIGYFDHYEDITTTHAIVVTVIVSALLLVLPIISHLRPHRSLQDTLAGTWLIPK